MAQTFPFRRSRVANDFPYDPFDTEGDKNDATYYVLKPGENFLQPWISIPGGLAFIFPLGIEGFSVSIESTLGIHRFIGDNKVAVDVVHRGEERLSMSGNFPGESSVSAFRALRDIVYAETPRGGKIVGLPNVLPYAQRMVVASARFDRPQDARGKDLSYDIEFVRLGYVKSIETEFAIEKATPQPSTGTATSAKKFNVNSKYNTLRKIAQYKLGSATKWQRLYTLNAKVFRKLNVPAMKAPDYRLPLGTVIYY
jgi:hypothetical protein